MKVINDTYCYIDKEEILSLLIKHYKIPRELIKDYVLLPNSIYIELSTLIHKYPCFDEDSHEVRGVINGKER